MQRLKNYQENDDTKDDADDDNTEYNTKTTHGASIVDQFECHTGFRG